MASIQGDSPHAVAFALLEAIAAQEGKPLGERETGPDKQWVLATYKECLDVVLSIRRYGAGVG